MQTMHLTMSIAHPYACPTSDPTYLVDIPQKSYVSNLFMYKQNLSSIITEKVLNWKNKSEKLNRYFQSEDNCWLELAIWIFLTSEFRIRKMRTNSCP